MYNNIDDNITVTERGWAGHFICGSRCIYHRNTLISYNDKKIIVSTIGRYKPALPDPEYCLHLIAGFESLGGGGVEGNRYYETEIGFAEFNSGYWEYSPDKEIYHDLLMEYQCKISRLDPSFFDSDRFADEYHDKTVQTVIDLLKENKL